MSLLTKEQILGKSELPHEDVDVPEWGGTVRVRGLSGKERDQYEASCTPPKKGAPANLENMRARLVVKAVIDEAGNRLFSDSDVKRLGELSSAGLDRVFEVATRLSGMSEKDVKELEKNSATDPNDSSGIE